jgi:TonB family protein
MAKVVKFCAACEEGFAEKFGFCPNCGGALAAYELNPVVEKSSVGATENIEARNVSPVVNETPPIVEEPVTEAFSVDEEDELLEIDGFSQQEAAPFVPVNSENNFNHSSNGSEYSQNGQDSSNVQQEAATVSQPRYAAGNYHITFVEEQDSSNRNMLLLGAFLLVTTISFGAVLHSLFGKDLFIGSMAGDSSILSLVTVEPEPVIEVEPPKPKGKDEGGGGGGGGKREAEVPKGEMPSQSREPKAPPTTKVFEGTQPVPRGAIQTPNEVVSTKPVGNPLGRTNIQADGPGTGGGVGTGTGTGWGSGRGSGGGSGVGSGIGGGRGSGFGDGSGSGTGGGEPPPPKPKPPVGPTVRVQILSKPRPSYTDAARQNQVTGVVRLRVTFLASGQIGAVSPVSGLSYGLTEQAIAAAKQIRFEPAKVNGVPQTVSMTIEYSFSIY